MIRGKYISAMEYKEPLDNLKSQGAQILIWNIQKKCNSANILILEFLNFKTVR